MSARTNARLRRAAARASRAAGVRPGAIYEDTDPRWSGRRRIVVVRLDGVSVLCRTLTDWRGRESDRPTRIRADRLCEQRGYRLVRAGAP